MIHNKVKNLIKTIFVICLLTQFTMQAQYETLTKANVEKISTSLADDANFQNMVMDVTLFSLSGAPESLIESTVSTLNQYGKLMKVRYSELNLVNQNETEIIVSSAIDKILEKESLEQKGFDQKCLDACTSRWRSCASLGWKEGLLIGCVAIGVGGIIAAAIWTEGATLTAVTEQLLWVRNGCAAALGVVFSGREAVCYETYTKCSEKCD